MHTSSIVFKNAVTRAGLHFLVVCIQSMPTVPEDVSITVVRMKIGPMLMLSYAPYCYHLHIMLHIMMELTGSEYKDCR